MKFVGLGLFTVVLFPGPVLAQATCLSQCETVGKACIDACGYFECEEKCLRDQKECVSACPAPSKTVCYWKDGRQPFASSPIFSPKKAAVSPVL